MAVYRSDQAQLTFAAEAAPGGSPERLEFAGSGSIQLQTAASAGDRTLNLSANTSNVGTGAAGAFICIEPDEDGTTSDSVIDRGTSEVRRVVNVSGSGVDTVVTLDYPIAFDHTATATTGIEIADNLTIIPGASTPYITWIPGIYDTVDAPDPEEAHEARYMLGQNTKRNAYQIVKGQQSFNGTVSGMVLINGWPLRFPIGSVVTAPSYTGSAFKDTTLTVTGNKGSVWLKIMNETGSGITAGNHLFANGNYIDIEYTASVPTATSVRELRKIIDGGSGSTLGDDGILRIRVNYPLQFDHSGSVVIRATAAANVVGSEGDATVMTGVTHHIFEQTALTNMTWNLNVKDEDGTNAFQRRYYGGKVTGLTLTAEEGGLVMCDWDTAQFLGMIHNQKYSASTSASALAMRRYNPMIDIDKGMVGAPLDGDATVASHANTLPTSEPYYFSEGSVKLFRTTVARLRTFTLTIANNEEARYYLRQTYNDDRGPFEIKEQQREYAMSATIGLPDSSDPDTAAGLEVWKELVLGGEHDTAGPGGSTTGMTGFDVELKFQRGGSSSDQITVRIPGNYDGTTPQSAKGGGYQQQGALIRSAAVNIDGSNPMEQSVDILFSDLKIEVTDSEPFYP